MRKDFANIYNLPKKDFDEMKESKKYWEDLLPGTQGFAETIFNNDIKSKELPYVMSIEGGFGSGKTHFATRFCEHIKDKGIDAIYMDALKYDYSNPLLCITKQICNQLHFKDKSKDFMDKVKNLFKSSSLSINLPFGIDLGIKFEDLFCDSGKNAVQEFKKYLSKQVEKKRLVLIIDELDRCRPDFSIHLIETIKHFFDIDGLFTILVLDNEFFIQSLKSVYGPAFGDNNTGEHYLDKFVHSRIKMYHTNEDEYKKIIEKFMGEYVLDSPSIEALLKIEYENFDDINKRCIFGIFMKYKLSLRQSKGVCEEIVGYYKFLLTTSCIPSASKTDLIAPPAKEDGDMNLFAHLACEKFIDKGDAEYKQVNKDEIEKVKESWNQLASNNDKNLNKLLLDHGIKFEFLICPEYRKVYDKIVNCANFLFRNSGGSVKQFAESYILKLFEMYEFAYSK